MSSIFRFFIVLILSASCISAVSEAQNTSFSGDVRLRCQLERREGAEDRYRSRMRFRYAFEGKVNDKISVGLRLSTGAADPTSANQTFENMFSSKPIWLDRAYLEVRPAAYFSFIGGKMKNPFYSTELVWDSDISPEGFNLRVKHKPGDKSELLINLAAFPLDEFKDETDDPILLGVFGDLSTNALLARKIRLSAAYYDFHNMKGKAVEDICPDYIKKTNSLQAEKEKTYLIYDYKLINAILEFSPVDTPIPVKLYADLVKNVAEDVDKSLGWLLGLTLGSAKKSGDFQIDYSYRKTEKDAVPAMINDSDFHGGGTDNKGHKIGLRYVFFDKICLGAAYSSTRGLKDNSKLDRFQVDMVVEF